MLTQKGDDSLKKLRIFSIILILLGISIIIYALGVKHFTIKNQEDLTKRYEDMIVSLQNDIPTNNDNDESNDISPSNKSEDSKSETTAINNQNAPKKMEEKAPTKDTQDDLSNILGVLIIDKINLKVCVNEGTDMSTLKYAVGHFEGTALPGQLGNFALAGHRSYAFGDYFNRLDELSEGDNITIKTVNGTYSYTVYGKKVVLPEEVEVLNPTDDATMTLITCTPIRIATHRLIINARLNQ